MLASVTRSHSDCLPQRLLGALARQEDALGVLQGDGAQPFLLVVLRRHQPPPSTFRRERGAEHARPDLRERRVAGRRRVVAEGREPAVVAVVPSCSTGMYRAASRTRSRTSSGVSTRGSIGSIDADEHPLVRLQVLADDLQDAGAVLLARQGDVEVPDLQLEQAGQQLGVIDVAAVGRVAVAAGAGVDADALAVLGGEPRQREVVQVDEAVQQVAGRVDLDRQPALREVDLHLVGALAQAVADLGLVLARAGRR